MTRRYKTKGSAPRFVQIWEWELKCPAYRHLSVYGRALLIEFRMKYTGSNNGDIVFSVRQAARALNCNKDTAAKILRELEDKGWTRQTQKGSFNWKTQPGARKVRPATTWRITNQPIGLGVSTPETKEYARWKPTSEIQNAVPSDGTICPTTSHHAEIHGPTTSDHTPQNCPTTSDHAPPKPPPYGPTRPDTSISTTLGDQKDGHRQVGIEDLEGGERPHIRLSTDPFGFGTMVREARKAKGWSQEQAADAVGISRPGLGNIETGRYPAGQSLRARLAAVLELAP